MTSLLGRLLPLFTGARRVEDLFTEAVARLFERRPELCLSWLEDLDLIMPVSEEDQRYIHVTTQKSFVALEEHGSGSRPDLIVEVHHASEDAESESFVEIVMVESKIGSWEGQGQLRKYAEHLDKMIGSSSKTLLYVTRAYDPKDKMQILSGVGETVRFEQLRWHDFYRFLYKVEKDALVEEVMIFMEEQGMARTYRFSATDLVALSGVPRAFEIMDETFDEEVRSKLESFAGNKVSTRADYGLNQVRGTHRYIMLAPLHASFSLYCYVGYRLRTSDGYPVAFVILEAPPNRAGEDISVAAMKSVARREDWEGHSLGDSTGVANVERKRSLATLLLEEDHVAAVKRFFIDSIRQLREELTAFKQEYPEFPWSGK